MGTTTFYLRRNDFGVALSRITKKALKVRNVLKRFKVGLREELIWK